MPNNIDIYDKNDQPTGRQSSIDQAMRRGLWHRGVHIIIYTRNGKVLVQKRSSTIIMHPGFLDISCGGFVDAGETPEQAAVREMHEELGLRVAQNDLRPLGIRRKNHVWPRLHKYDRVILYCYAVCLPDEQVDISHLQKSEVQWAGFVTFRRARQLVRRHQLKGFGRIEPVYAFYKWLLDQAAVIDKA